MIIKSTKWIITSLSLVVLFVLICMYHDSIKLKEVKFPNLEDNTKNKGHNPLRNNKVVITDIYMGLGDDSSIWIQLATPYKNNKQQTQLCKYSNVIKNDFLLGVEEKKLKHWARSRNFRAVKKNFLSVVNKYVEEPISTVYLNQFFMND